MKSSSVGSSRRLLASALALSLCAVAAAPPADPAYQTLSLGRSKQNHLLLRAEINGKAAVLGVDSGAPLSAIASDRRKHFGVTAPPAGSDLPLRLRVNRGFPRLFVAHRLRFGALTLVDEPLITINLNAPSPAVREIPEERLDGLIGTDILIPLGAVLDCARQVLVTRVEPDAPGRTPGFDHRGWTAVPIRVTRGWNLLVTGQFNGVRGQLLIDTGAVMTLLDDGFVRQLGLDLTETPLSSSMVNLDDQGVLSTTVNHFEVGGLAVGRFTFGGFHVKDEHLGVIDLSEFVAGDLTVQKPRVVGFLGGDFLQQHHGIIDFGTRTLYLKL